MAKRENNPANPPAAKVALGNYRSEIDPVGKHPILNVRLIAYIPGDTGAWIYADDERQREFEADIEKAVVERISAWDDKCHNGVIFPKLAKLTNGGHDGA